MSWVGAAIVTSSVIGADAAGKAADIQAGAQRDALAYQKQQYEDIRKLSTGGRAAGANALNQLGALGSGTYGMYDAEGNQIGTGTGSGYFTQQYTPEEFAKGQDPGYQFRLQQGQEATNRMANMGGGMISGNALKGQEDYTQGLASTEFTNAFNRFQTGRQNIYNTLAGIAGLGQNSTNTAAGASNVASTNVGNTISNLGAAQAGGIVGQANAITGGLQNWGNQQYLSNLLASKGTQVAGIPTSSGGGASGAGGGYVAPTPSADPISQFRVNTA
jgi:hypothetical protein